MQRSWTCATSKNCELDAQFRKFKALLPRADDVKDDSGSNAVFTEQGSSASQTTAANVMDVIARLPDCAWTSSRRSVSVHPSQNEKRSTIFQNSKVRDAGVFTYQYRIASYNGLLEVCSWDKLIRGGRVAGYAYVVRYWLANLGEQCGG